MGSLTNNGTVTLNSDADEFASIIVQGSSTGDIVYNRYVNTVGTAEWDLIVSPVDGLSISSFVTTNSTPLATSGSIYAVGTYDNSNDTWTNFTTSSVGAAGNFDLRSSHVLPAMLRKFHEAKINNHSEVTLWGSGTPMREFLFIDDMAEAVIYALENNLPEHLYNIGTGKDITIKELAETIQSVTGHQGNIIWDATKPDGTPRKLMDISKMKGLGWQYSIELEDGIEKTYQWFLENIDIIKEIKL